MVSDVCLLNPVFIFFIIQYNLSLSIKQGKSELQSILMGIGFRRKVSVSHLLLQTFFRLAIIKYN
jgi:hypothetical protein